MLNNRSYKVRGGMRRFEKSQFLLTSEKLKIRLN